MKKRFDYFSNKLKLKLKTRFFRKGTGFLRFVGATTPL